MKDRHGHVRGESGEIRLHPSTDVLISFCGSCVQGTLLFPIPLGKTCCSIFLGLSGAAGLRSPQSGSMMLRSGD